VKHNVPLAPAITDLEMLKDRPQVASLLQWNTSAVEGAKLDREELSIYISREFIRRACEHLKSAGLVDFLSDLTCADYYPRTPRFEVVYHLLSIRNKQRVRLKVRLEGDDPVIESITAVWPAANFFEREVFDLFGIRFLGHPYLRRIMMPEDWEGHPLRRDYPVEGYR
jgi:NADH-quinone oxidoreductase subunit C